MLLPLHPSPQELHPVCWRARTWMLVMIVLVLTGSWLLSAASPGARAPGGWFGQIVSPIVVPPSVSTIF